MRKTHNGVQDGLEGSKGLGLINGLLGRLTLSRKSLNKYLKETRHQEDFWRESTPGGEKSKCKRPKVSACLTRLRDSQDDSK